MLRFTCLPKPVANWLHVLQPMFHHRHHLVFCWLLVCQAIYQEKATINGLARLSPHHIAEWHLRRLLTAAYWNWRVLLWWFADQVIATLPPPDDGVCYLGYTRYVQKLSLTYYTHNLRRQAPRVSLQ